MLPGRVERQASPVLTTAPRVEWNAEQLDSTDSGMNPAARVIETVALTRSGGATTVFDKTTKDREVKEREPNTTKKGPSILSIISKDMHMKGNCETDGQLLIEGKISGNVIARGVEVAPSGSVRGDVIAAEKAAPDQVFIIDGLVTGAVHAAQVEVRRQ